MKVEFIVGEAEQPYDLVLSDLSSLQQISIQFGTCVQQARPGAILHISMMPPVHPELSIPASFRIIMGYVKDLDNKNLTLYIYLASSEAIDYLYKYLPEGQRLSKRFHVEDFKVDLCMGDIVTAGTEALVNASNRSLRLGGGVSGSIRKAAAPSLQAEMNRIAASQSIAAGDAILTDAYGIKKVKYLIHTATDSGDPRDVRHGIRNALRLCKERQIRSVAFPAIGTGTGKLPTQMFAEIMAEELVGFAAQRGTSSLQHVVLVCWTRAEYETISALFTTVFG